ncbi:hypothetical protein CWR48_15775 [Oceanobacillus arenosus]|uniref:Uncharacterized protein n=1 Tax=Oceanobacillus arenosus TaxID=1229153 RepID=A0A3D8PKD4_9BACI|nr:hypothetical protein [Oceanobacillus arenosus]RDW16504.1 hypothetical protein CWR48_15775 [Oceanobacillus arenosus]
MSKKFDNHLTGFGDWKDWEDYEEYGESEWSNKESWYNAYRDTPSKEECDRISAALSGEVKVYFVKK